MRVEFTNWSFSVGLVWLATIHMSSPTSITEKFFCHRPSQIIMIFYLFFVSSRLLIPTTYSNKWSIKRVWSLKVKNSTFVILCKAGIKRLAHMYPHTLSSVITDLSTICLLTSSSRGEQVIWEERLNFGPRRHWEMTQEMRKARNENSSRWVCSSDGTAISLSPLPGIPVSEAVGKANPAL